MNNIKVSVIMPVYNSGAYLETAVESILSQSLHEIELILVDDGSTDGSSERCDEYAAKDSRVVVIHEKNGGICAARNTALAIARGEYIGFSDHDDETEHDAFEKAYSFAKSDNLDFVKYGHAVKNYRDGKLAQTTIFQFDKNIFTDNEVGENYLQLLKDGAMQCIWDSLFKRDFLQKHHLELDTSFKAGGEDIDFCGRVISEKPKLGIMHDVLYNHLYRIGTSTSSKFNEVNISLALTFPKRLNDYLSSYNTEQIFNSNPQLYAYNIVYRAIGAVMHAIAQPGCNYSVEKVCSILEQLYKDTSIAPCFFKVPQLKFLSYDKRYGILYMLFRHRWFKTIAKLYIRRRNVQR